jgi:8-oxo-dGTP diphosphatase
MIEVVAAVVMQSGRFLVTSRPEGVHLAGMWEFPGGKSSPSESHHAALAREMHEELGVSVGVHELVFTTTHEYADRTVALYFYRCTLDGQPRPLIGQRVRWVTPAELSDLEFPPADAELIAVLRDW